MASFIVPVVVCYVVGVAFPALWQCSCNWLPAARGGGLVRVGLAPRAHVVFCGLSRFFVALVFWVIKWSVSKKVLTPGPPSGGRCELVVLLSTPFLARVFFSFLSSSE